MAILDSDDLIGIDPAELSFAIRSSGSHPIVLGNDIRGTLQSIVSRDKKLTDISGRRIEEGMLVYLKYGYTDSSVTFDSDTYYIYKIHESDSEGRN